MQIFGTINPVDGEHINRNNNFQSVSLPNVYQPHPKFTPSQNSTSSQTHYHLIFTLTFNPSRLHIHPPESGTNLKFNLTLVAPEIQVHLTLISPSPQFHIFIVFQFFFACLLLFRCATGEAWQEIMLASRAGQECNPIFLESSTYHHGFPDAAEDPVEYEKYLIKKYRKTIKI